MKDQVFIDEILKKGKEASDKVTTHFSGISVYQLNWKPSPESWSIGLCLDHLIISDKLYFPALEKITAGNYKKTFLQRFSPFTNWWGRMFKNNIQERVKRKMKAPKILKPVSSDKKVEIIDEYFKSLDTFSEFISNCCDVDLDKTIITSPVIGMVTYKLRDTFQFLLQHEHRHLNQAIRVKNHENFPEN